MGNCKQKLQNSKLVIYINNDAKNNRLSMSVKRQMCTGRILKQLATYYLRDTLQPSDGGASL